MLKYLQNRCFRPKYRFYMTFYRKFWKKIDFFFCSGDHSRPFWLSKINFLVSKSRNFMKFCKIDFWSKNHFLYKNQFLDLKKPEKTWKNLEKTWKNLEKPGNFAYNRTSPQGTSGNIEKVQTQVPELMNNGTSPETTVFHGFPRFSTVFPPSPPRFFQVFSGFF